MRTCQYRFPDGPLRGLRCGAEILTVCDRSEPSELVDWKGEIYKQKWMFPNAAKEKQPQLCYYHQRIGEDIVGKES